MAQKLNKRLVFIVGGMTLLLGVAGAGFLVLQRLDTDRYIRSGDQLAASGDWRRAAESYGRAVRKKPGNVAYLEKFEDAVREIVPETSSDARERYSQLLSVLQALANAERDDVERWRTYLEAYMEQCEALGGASYWKSLADQCDDMQRVVPTDGELALLARAYRGYAGAQRLNSLDDAARATVAADLRAASGASTLTPRETDLVFGSLARIAVEDYSRAKGIGQADRLESARKAADEAIATALEKAPDGVVARRARFERASIDANGNQSDPAFVAATSEYAGAARRLGDSAALLSTATSLIGRGPAAMDEARRLLEEWIARNPDALLHRRALAAVLRVTDSAAALAQIDAISSAPRPKTSLVSATYDGNVMAAAATRFDIEFDRFERASEVERPAILPVLEEARRRLSDLFAGAADTSPVLRAEGKILLAKNEFAPALVKFNEVFRKGSEIDLELHLLSAMCSMRLGETGRALELVNGGLRLSPFNEPLLMLKAQLEMSAARPAEALATVRTVLERSPDNEDARALATRIEGVMASDPTTATGAAAILPQVAAFGRIQEAIESKDFELARRLLGELRASGQDGAGIARFAVTIESQAGDLEAARRILAESLTRFPEDPVLLRFKAIVGSDDPVGRIVMLVDATTEDESLRPVLVFMRLLESASAVRENAEREKRFGVATADATAKLADRLEAGLAEWRTKAEQADRTHPILLEADFRQAIAKKDWEAARAVARIAQQSSRDPAQGALLLSQLASAQGNFREAAAVLDQAVQAGLDNSIVFRSMGSALEQSGNIEGAIRQYEESYKRRPSDMQTVRLLVGALVRSGGTQRALEILREARQLSGFDSEVAEVWLGLEAQIGDRRLVRRLRENQYVVAPQDQRNALALGNLLALGLADREDVLNERGQVAYNETQWNLLDPSMRIELLERTRAAWRARAEELFRAGLKREPANLDMALAFSNMLRSLGRAEESERVLAESVAAGGDASGWRGHVALGTLQVMNGALDRAKASFDEAIRREDPTTRDATRAIVDALFGNGRYLESIAYLEPLTAVDGSRMIRLRLAECYLRAGRSADARKAFDAGVGSDERDMTAEMLDGAILLATADELRAMGRLDEAKSAYEASLAPYQRAKRLSPAAPQPFIQDSVAKRRLFELTGDPQRGQEALAAADRAVLLGGALFASSLVRSDALLALGDVQGAVAELDRYLRLAPMSTEARERIVSIHENRGDLARAEEAARAAAEVQPGSARWHLVLASVQFRQGRFAEAARSYSLAYTLEPQPVTFYQEMESRIRARDFRGAVDSARRRPEVMRASNSARAYVGVALFGGAERGEGLKTLTETYVEARAAFDRGDPGLLLQWYEAFKLLFAPNELATAEQMLVQLGRGSPDVLGREILARLALADPSSGPAKAVEYLAPVAEYDFGAMKDLGARLLDRYGTTLFLAKQCETAVGVFEKALALAPRSDYLLNNYAYLCGECLRDAKRGLPSARLAVQLAPNRAEYLDTLGSLLLLDGQLDEAEEMLRRAAAIANSANVQYHLAQVHVAKGRTASAREAVEAALRMNPDGPTRTALEEMLAKLR